MAGAYELIYLGTCMPRVGRPFSGPLDPQFPKGTRFGLEVGRRMAIGRAADAGILVDSMIIARHHAAVTLEPDGRLLIENLGGGGVFVSGVYVSDTMRIGVGDVFELAGQLVFQLRQG